MTVEADIVAVLQAVTPHVFADFAPAGTAAPWVSYQFVGGRSLRWLNGTPSDKRHSLVQINVWAATRGAAQALIRQIETALCDGAAPFTATPEAEPTGTAEEDIPLYGAQQDFSVYSAR